MYEAHKYYGLEAYVAEKYSTEASAPLNAFYSVAVVKASKCAEESESGTLQNLASLEVGSILCLC